MLLFNYSRVGVFLNWFDYFVIILFFVLFLLLLISLILFVVSYVKSIIFVHFLKNIEKKGIRLKFIEYLNYDISDKIE